ncbi:hypothetical protein LVO85_00655 [Ornithinimicrobium sp. EGI L100131]|nr:hypothetical protein [Ornithinimicrobium sediminis]MCE0485360.1 hypothetical protein [Ornithinimicrobium sediminis]
MQVVRDVTGLDDLLGVGRHRPQEGHVVHPGRAGVLERTSALPCSGHLTGDAQHRGLVGVRRRQGADHVGDARPADGQADTEAATGSCVPVGHEGGPALMGSDDCRDPRGLSQLMPFTDDAVGTGRIAEPWATVAFAVNVGLLSLAVGALARHVQRDVSVHHPGRPPHGLDRHRRHHLYLLPAVTAGAVVLAFVQPLAAVGVLFAEVVWAGWRGLRGTG